MTLRDQAHELLSDLRSESERDRESRESGASDEELALAARKVELWLEGGGSESVSGLGRLATDRWSLTDPIADRTVRFERDVLSREKESRDG